MKKKQLQFSFNDNRPINKNSIFQAKIDHNQYNWLH